MTVSEKLESARAQIQINAENEDWLDYEDGVLHDSEVYENMTIEEIVEDFKLYQANI